MANVVYNILSIDGPNHNNIMQQLRSNESLLDFESVIPIPKSLKNNINKKISWKIKNWGTKSNASDVEIYDNRFLFLTAWNPPINLIKKLSKKFKNYSFNIKWANEDHSSNCGEYIFENGKMIYSKMPKDDNDINSIDEYYNELWGNECDGI